MKRATAWAGFYKSLKEIKACEKIAKADGHSCNVSTRWKMADMRAKRYARSLVLEHGWQDVHTAKYIVCPIKGGLIEDEISGDDKGL